MLSWCDNTEIMQFDLNDKIDAYLRLIAYLLQICLFVVVVADNDGKVQKI